MSIEIVIPPTTACRARIPIAPAPPPDVRTTAPSFLRPPVRALAAALPHEHHPTHRTTQYRTLRATHRSLPDSDPHADPRHRPAAPSRARRTADNRARWRFP